MTCISLAVILEKTTSLRLFFLSITDNPALIKLQVLVTIEKERQDHGTSGTAIFLAIAREENISRAAESLHLSQPTLSRQLKDMEEELGKQLVIRGSHSVTLTEEGLILRKRAEEIVELVRKAENEIALADKDVAGDICFGVAETDGIRLLAKVIDTMRREHPRVQYHFSSGNAEFVREQLDKGLVDFGLIYGEADKTKYHTLKVPILDRWGVLMRKDAPLAVKETISPKDLVGLPLIVSQQSNGNDPLSEWFGEDWEGLSIIATYNLAMNASILASEGVGYALCFDKLINVTGESNLCFRPLSPAVESKAGIIWKKYQNLPKAPRKFLELLKKPSLIFARQDSYVSVFSHFQPKQGPLHFAAAPQSVDKRKSQRLRREEGCRQNQGSAGTVRVPLPR